MGEDNSEVENRDPMFSFILILSKHIPVSLTKAEVGHHWLIQTLQTFFMYIIDTASSGFVFSKQLSDDKLAFDLDLPTAMFLSPGWVF